MRVRQREKAYSIADAQGVRPRLRQPRSPTSSGANKSELRRTLYAIIQETKNFPFRRHFPIDPAELVRGGQRGGPRSPPSGSTSCWRSRSGSKALQKLRDREPEQALAGALRPDARPDRRLPGQGLRVPRLPGRDGQDAAPSPRRCRPPDLIVEWDLDHSHEPQGPQGRDRQEVRRGHASCSRRSSSATPRPPGPTSPRTSSTAASASSATSGTTTRSTTSAPSSCRSADGSARWPGEMNAHYHPPMRTCDTPADHGAKAHRRNDGSRPSRGKRQTISNIARGLGIAAVTAVIALMGRSWAIISALRCFRRLPVASSVR